jgi:hypothetical protein
MARILGASVYAVGVDKYDIQEVNYFSFFNIFPFSSPELQYHFYS